MAKAYNTIPVLASKEKQRTCSEYQQVWYKRVMIRFFAVCVLTVLLTSCDSTEPAVEQPPEYQLSRAAEAYLEEVLDIMQTWSINRFKIDWSPFRKRAYERADGAQTTSDTYPAIQQAIEELGDNHSFFVPPGQSNEEATSKHDGSAAIPNWPVGWRLDSTAGYVMIPAFSSASPGSDVEFATDIRDIISAADTTGLCGWVVDLRMNMGGNMWPMVAGIGPVLGEGLAGMFVDPVGSTSEWGYENGHSWIGQGESMSVVASVSGEPYELIRSMPTVAVLTGPLTASSGEAVTVAFRERPGTRSFGLPTRGLSTANRTFNLSDGATLYLTISTFADRTGRLYGDVIEPDTTVTGWQERNPTTDDTIISVAQDWLAKHGDCGNQ